MPTEQQLYDLVVIGSSAGGIEALSRVLAALPASFPAPIVLAQHLDPARPSNLADILGRRSPLPVTTLSDAEPQRLESGNVYVVPEDRDVEIVDQTARLSIHAGRRSKPSIDLLLTTAAQVYGERLIAVILTGTGSDGTAGARNVKTAGGMVIVENPATAAYPFMPAALSPTTVDIAVDLDQLGLLLGSLLSGAYVSTHLAATTTLQSLLEQVREHTGIDFKQYKRSTILRRLQRRMAAVSTGTLDEYAQYLERHSEEYARLVSSFLINITEFFRDPDFFDYLRKEVIPELITYAREHDRQLRVWSAGCATGEEAYSLAILLAEILGDDLEHFNIRIFATDIDADAIAFARRGIYPAATLAALSPEYVLRYFTPAEDGFAVTKRIRGLVIFGEHDLGQRAPFPHIDLVLCRNVLIYFTTELQRHTLQVFAFSLREGGYLVLGTAETPSPAKNLFVPVQARLRIYRRHGERVLVPPVRMREVVLPVGEAVGAPAEPQPGAPAARPQEQRPHSEVRPRPEAVPMRAGRDNLTSFLLTLQDGIVIVDRDYDVHEINNAAVQLLGIYRPAIGTDLLHLVQNVPVESLRSALETAFRMHHESNNEASSMIVETTEAKPRLLHISWHPSFGAEHLDGPARPDAALLLISDVTEIERTRRVVEEDAAHTREAAAAGPPDVTERQAEIEHLLEQIKRLDGINRDLREANQEMAAANHELRRVNEDLLVGQEEAEASSEEVKTLNEELQATNEELETINEELEATNEEIHTTNDDLQARTKEMQITADELEAQRKISESERVRLAAVLSSMADALVVVDHTGAVVLANPAYERTFGGPPGDVVLTDTEGRPLAPEATPWSRAKEGKPFSMEFTMNTTDGSFRWFEAKGETFQNSEDKLNTVVTIHDITDRSLLRLQELFISVVTHELRAPLASIISALHMLTKQLQMGKTQQVTLLASIASRQAELLDIHVRDVADLESMRRGHLRLSMALVDLAALVQQVVATLDAILGGQEPHLVVHVAPADETALQISGDSLRLEQILINLLTNATKYAAETDHIDLRLRRTGGMAELQVQDYGPGIPAADLEAIFTPFYQVARPSSTSRGGLGLGLYIVRSLVEAHHGTIEVHSEEGKGTTFVLAFPLLHPGGQDA
jgi:two-component system CheB/CheR fusion protein